MLLDLPIEILITLLQDWLSVKNFVSIYYCNKKSMQLLENIVKNPNFILKPTTIVKDKYVEWFIKKSVKVNYLIDHCIDKYNSKIWTKNGKCHRDNDLPAIIKENKRKEYYKNGRRYNPNKK